jgi:hypothetical protein
MWFTRVADGLRGWFRVQANNGTLRTGLTFADFTVTIVDPANATSSILAVTESPLKGGLYFFTVPSLFLAAGIGEYGITVEVNTVTPPTIRATFSEVLKVNTKGFEDIASAAALADAVWDELIAGHLGAGSTGAFLSRIMQLAEPDVVIDKINNQIIVKDRTTAAVLLTYNVTGVMDTRVEELDG